MSTCIPRRWDLAVRAVLDAFSFVGISIAGWMNQHQHHGIEYLFGRKFGFSDGPIRSKSFHVERARLDRVTHMIHIRESTLYPPTSPASVFVGETKNKRCNLRCRPWAARCTARTASSFLVINFRC